MPPPQVSQIATQQPIPAGDVPVEMMGNTHRESIRSWFAERRRGGSLSSSDSGPKSPVLGQVQEMGRAEAGSVRYTGPPLGSPPTGIQVEFFVPPPQPPSPTVPAAAAQRASGPRAMEEIRSSVLRLQSGQLEETQIRHDVEAQQPPVAPQKTWLWWWQQPRWENVQNQLATAVIAGAMCIIVLAIYLGLALAKHLRLRQEWHVLMVLLTLVTTLFFCHSLVRLCMDLSNGERRSRFSRIPSVVGPGGYAMPRSPIRVNTEIPEIISGMKEPPPVYGLWRCSVRVNPNEFYWVRRQSGGQEMTSASRRRSLVSSPMSPRPPSYISDDGVSYATNAVPEIRTIPELPSERARF